MATQIRALWTYLSARWALATGDEEGSVVEKVILTAVFAALAIAVGAIIVAKVMDKANSINLNLKCVGSVRLRRRIVIDETGSVVEAAIAIPAAMLAILLSVQICLWAHASALVQAAATRGDQAACVEGGSLAEGDAEARLALATSARQVVTNPSVKVTLLPGDEVQVRVTGTTESIVPGIHLPVSAVRVGLRQEFRVGG